MAGNWAQPRERRRVCFGLRSALHTEAGVAAVVVRVGLGVDLHRDVDEATRGEVLAPDRAAPLHPGGPEGNDDRVRRSGLVGSAFGEDIIVTDRPAGQHGPALIPAPRSSARAD